MKKIEIILKNILLHIFLYFNKKETINSPITIDSSTDILCIRLNKIGDALVTTPLLHEIKKQFGCNIHVLADKKNHFIYRNNHDVKNVIVYDKGKTSIKELNKYVFDNNINIVLDLHDDVSTTVTVLMAKIKTGIKAGFLKKNKNIYTHLVNRPDASKTHVIDRFLKFLELFSNNCNPGDVNIIYRISQNKIITAEKYLADNRLTGNLLLGINISAGSDARFWGIENFIKLINAAAELNINPVILAAPNDINKAKRISNGKFPVFYSQDFEEFCAIISKLDMLFTPDTSIIHIASAFEVPVFGIYVKYNTTDMIWSPYKSEFECVITEEPDFRNLTFEQVNQPFIQFLKKQLNQYSS